MPNEPAALDVSILGHLAVTVDAVPVAISTRRQRSLLMLLALEAGRAVSVDRLIDHLWDGNPPPQAPVTLRSYVSNLRQALGGRDGAGSLLKTRGQGYQLDVDPSAVDAHRLRLSTEKGRQHLHAGEHSAALSAFDDALRLWRGEPLAEIADHEVAQPAAAALREAYLGSLEGRYEALLALGRHDEALPGLEELIARDPLRERPRSLQMLALYRVGRVPEALETFRTFKSILDDELGIDPSAHLEELHGRMLDRDPSLNLLVPPSAATHERSNGATEATSAPSGPTPLSAPLKQAPMVTSPTTPTFVGRNYERQLIEARLLSMISGSGGSLVLVSGEAGIGKSSLLDQVAARARELSVDVHQGRSLDAVGLPPFWMWTHVLESIASALTDHELKEAAAGASRAVADIAPGLAERISRAPRPVGDDLRTLRFELYDAITEFLRRISRRPTLIILDDVQWADVPSLEMLSYLAPALASTSLLVVAGYREHGAERAEPLQAMLSTMAREERVTQLRLTGLSPSEVEELISSLLSAQDRRVQATSFAAMLHQRSGGNPFFIRQLGTFVLEDDLAAADAVMPLPPAVRHVVSDRLRRLSPATRQLLEVAAVVGRRFEVGLVAGAAAADASSVLDDLDEAQRHGLVDPVAAGGYQFTHALVHEAVVEDLPHGRATNLHARVAGELAASRGPVERIAEHWWQARDVAGPEAVHLHVVAAERAMHVWAYEQAEVYLRRGLELAQSAHPPAPHDELNVLLVLFRLVATSRGWGDEDARALVQRGRELVRDLDSVPSGTVRLWWGVWLFLLDRGDLVAASEVTETLERTLSQESEPADRAALHMMMFFRCLASSDPAGAFEHLNSARLAAGRADHSSLASFDEHLDVMIMLTEAHAAALTDQADRHRSLVDGAVALADADGRPFVRAVAYTLASVSACFIADSDFAAQLADRAVELARRFSFSWLERVAETTSAVAGVKAGGVDEGFYLETIHRVELNIAWLRESGRVGNLATMRAMAAEAHHAWGDRQSARTSWQAVADAPGPYGELMSSFATRRGVLE